MTRGATESGHGRSRIWIWLLCGGMPLLLVWGFAVVQLWRFWESGGTPTSSNLVDARQVWRHDGAYAIASSPRVKDVNGDGIGDVLIGHGSEMGIRDSHVSWGYVVAIDGATGSELWRVEADEAVVGTAAFADLTGDGREEMIIGGRAAELMAIVPRDGRVLWRFDREAYPDYRFNFYTTAVVPDQNGDGISDLVTAHGGDSSIPKGEPRDPGFLLLLSGGDGTVISALETPDSAETFMSPVVYEVDGERFVLFGTGGEALAGSLWRISLFDLQQNRNNATRLLTSETKGFIAPPSLADVTSDGTPDIISQAFDGRLTALDGRTLSTIWTWQALEAESVNSPAIGLFNEDEVPDVFAGIVYGEFPHYTNAKFVIIDGRSGKVLWKSLLGWRSASGPLAIDLDGDGRDEGLVGVVTPHTAKAASHYQLYSVHLRNGRATPLGPILGQDSIAAPWVGDIDNDGTLEVVASASSAYEGRGTTGATMLLKLDARRPDRISWGGYLGNDGDAAYRGD